MRNRQHIVVALTILAFYTSQIFCLKNGLALTPPMGFSSWNTFGMQVNETIFYQMADVMATNGMRDVGYEYIIVDEPCFAGRDHNGTLIPNPVTFPNGMKKLGDYIHSKGLKFGMYTDAGTETCGGCPGSYNYEAHDMKTFADWGVDYIKVDFCYLCSLSNQPQQPATTYSMFRDAILATNRSIIFSIVVWGVDSPWLWGANVGHLWRTTGDINANWWRIMDILDAQEGLEQYAGPGGWNDPDMLEVGQPSLTVTESRAHFSLWAMLNAPLLAGNDLRTMSKEILAILTNKEVIALNQDPLGIQARKVAIAGNVHVWLKPLHDQSFALCLFNRGSNATAVSIPWSTFRTTGPCMTSDLWSGSTYFMHDAVSASIAPHDVFLVRVRCKVPPLSIYDFSKKPIVLSLP
jgi:alpha-galactosidase